MFKCAMVKVVAAVTVAVGGVGLGAYYDPNGEVLNYVGLEAGHTCPLAALSHGSSCASESSCSLAKSSGCCLAAPEVAVGSSFDPIAATVGGVAFAGEPAVEPLTPAAGPAPVSDAAQSPQ